MKNYLTAIGFTLSFAAAESYCQSPSEKLEDLRIKIAEAQKKYKDTFNDTFISYRMVVTNKMADQASVQQKASPIPEKDLIVKLQNYGGCVLALTEPAAPQKQDDSKYSIECDNPKYSFQLGRKKSSDQPFLRKMETAAEKKSPFTARTPSIIKQLLDDMNIIPFACDSNNNCKVLNHTEDSAGETIGIEIEVPIKPGLRRYYKVVVDKFPVYHCKNSFLEDEYGSTASSYEYGQFYGDVPVPTKIVVEHFAKPNKGSAPYTMTFELLEIRKADGDLEKYRLSAFGLPEPAGVEWPKSTPNYIWLSMAAGLAGILAILFRRMARRKQIPGEVAA